GADRHGARASGGGCARRAVPRVRRRRLRPHAPAGGDAGRRGVAAEPGLADRAPAGAVPLDARARGGRGGDPAGAGAAVAVLRRVLCGLTGEQMFVYHGEHMFAKLFVVTLLVALAVGLAA